jgi:hypothetical protein
MLYQVKNGDFSPGSEAAKKVSRRQYFFEQHLSAQEAERRHRDNAVLPCGETADQVFCRRQINCLMTTAARM